MINVILLAISVSIDAIGIGISYGIRNSYIRIRLIFLIAFIVFSMCLIGLLLGNLLSLVLSDFLLKIIGSLILFILGVFIVLKEIINLKPKNDFRGNKKESKEVKRIENIKATEAIYLAMCISVDALTSGISASLIGIRSIFFPILVMVCHMTFLKLGMYVGKNVSIASSIPQNIWKVISGILLILISIGKLFLN